MNTHRRTRDPDPPAKRTDPIKEASPTSDEDHDDLETLLLISVLSFSAGLAIVFWLEEKWGWIVLACGTFSLAGTGVVAFLDWFRRTHPD
jgi:hypothetical protein